MDNENKDILGEEKVQKMKDDVSAKIADAAAEIKEEIEDANAEVQETSAELQNAVSDTQEKLEDAFKEISPAELKPQKKSVNLSVGSLVGIIAGCVVVAVLIAVLCFNFIGGSKNPNYGSKAEGKTVATVGDEKLTDKDLNYYIYAEAMNQYYQVEGANATGDFSDFDWNQEVDGKKLSDTIKENAYDNAVNDLVTIQQGEQYLSDDEKWSDTDEQQAVTTVSGYVSQFGEDGFTLRARSMGISSPNQYARTYKTVIKTQGIQGAMEDDISKFMPEGVDLSQYVQDDRASVKHVLIMTTDASAVQDPAATPDPDAVDEATGLATAQTVAEQAKAGTDFDQLIQTYNKDTGEPTSGYTFRTGEMVEEFEKAAFALKLDEVSDPVKTEYGYHVIKRIAGLYEIQGYWKDQVKIKENKGNLDKIDVAAVMNDVISATNELEAEEEAEASSADTSADTSSADTSSAEAPAADSASNGQ